MCQDEEEPTLEDWGLLSVVFPLLLLDEGEHVAYIQELLQLHSVFPLYLSNDAYKVEKGVFDLD